jgi:hypothetical protein
MHLPVAFSRAWVLASILAASPFARAAELPDGFRGLAWGSTVSALGSDSIPLIQDRVLPPDETCFSRPSDKLEFDRTPLKAIDYCYYKGKLYTVTLVALDAYAPFLESSLNQAFGKPANGVWGSSKGPTGAVLMRLGPSAHLMLSSTKALAQRRSDEAKRVLKSF